MEKYFKRTIELAKRSSQESDKINPYVGAIIIDSKGNIVGEAYRGEINKGEHGEFTLLERKLPNASLTGYTLFVTLEPCTKRGKEKIPCADRIIERKIKKVFIGMLDPNPDIQGHGVRKLENAGIDVQFFPEIFKNQISELNREFIRSQNREKPNEFFDLNHSISKTIKTPNRRRISIKSWIIVGTIIGIIGIIVFTIKVKFSRKENESQEFSTMKQSKTVKKSNSYLDDTLNKKKSDSITNKNLINNGTIKINQSGIQNGDSNKMIINNY